jgi:hypothetical protein
MNSTFVSSRVELPTPISMMSASHSIAGLRTRPRNGRLVAARVRTEEPLSRPLSDDRQSLAPLRRLTLGDGCPPPVARAAATPSTPRPCASKSVRLRRTAPISAGLVTYNRHRACRRLRPACPPVPHLGRPLPSPVAYGGGRTHSGPYA